MLSGQDVKRSTFTSPVPSFSGHSSDTVSFGFLASAMPTVTFVPRSGTSTLASFANQWRDERSSEARPAGASYQTA